MTLLRHTIWAFFLKLMIVNFLVIFLNDNIGLIQVTGIAFNHLWYLSSSSNKHLPWEEQTLDPGHVGAPGLAGFGHRCWGSYTDYTLISHALFCCPPTVGPYSYPPKGDDSLLLRQCFSNCKLQSTSEK